MYRTHFMLGAVLFAEHRLREGEQEFHEALRLFPYDPLLTYNLADQYRLSGLCAFALPYYKWSYAVDRRFHKGEFNYAACLLATGHYAAARDEALTSLRYGGPLPYLHQIIAAAGSAIRKTGNDGPPVDVQSMMALMERTRAAADSSVRAGARAASRTP